MSTPNTKNVFQRLNAVMATGASYLKKSKQVGTGNSAYKAVEWDALVAQIRKLFIENGLVLVVKTAGLEPIIDRKTSAGNPIYLTTGKFIVEVVNVDSPEDKIEIATYGYGLDNGDKGINKASTQAAKQALMKLLLVETGDDEESRAEDDGGSAPADDGRATQAQTGMGVEALDALVKEVQEAKDADALGVIYKRECTADAKAKYSKAERTIYNEAVKSAKAKFAPAEKAAA